MCLGVEHEENTHRKIAIYSRVSSPAQAAYLSSQQERQRQYVLEKYGEGSPLVFSEICSAWGDRKVLYSMLDRLPEISLICCEYKNRLQRSVCLRLLIENLCQKTNTKIEYMNNEEGDPSTAAFDVEEVLSYMTVLSCRQAGRRSGSRRKIDISTEVMKECVLSASVYESY